MDSSSAVSTRPASGHLDRLPSELWIHVFESIETTKDIKSLISASPTALSCFQSYKNTILRSHVKWIMDHIIDAGYVPLVLAMIKIRDLLYKRDLTTSHIKDKVTSLLTSLLIPYNPNPFQNWDQNLGTVSKLVDFIPEIEKTVEYYKMVRTHNWQLCDSSSFRPLHGEPAVSNTELRNFLEYFICHTILLNLSIYPAGTFFNEGQWLLDQAVWETMNPTLEDSVPDFWELSSVRPGGWAVNDRALVHTAMCMSVYLLSEAEEPGERAEV
ncbi:hypothetical protein FBEOM_8530 [Fusarium beomiforme]|uniref:F-box domain-containing protein n=1 Tax=Fusarium beomiforme TaxID=44412 RepID=A0A9P5DU68_9HYPO|nr:hypothetical protein FBEOM_8530 [Fusarium beomiforme]